MYISPLSQLACPLLYHLLFYIPLVLVFPHVRSGALSDTSSNVGIIHQASNHLAKALLLDPDVAGPLGNMNTHTQISWVPKQIMKKLYSTANEMK